MKKLLSIVIATGLSCSMVAAPFQLGQNFIDQQVSKINDMSKRVTIPELKERLKDKNLTKPEYKSIQRQIKDLEKSAKSINPNDFKVPGLQKRS